jgi:hypothetical protein
MFKQITSTAAIAAFAALLAAGPSQAAMAPLSHFGDTNIQRTDCAVGFHLGPAGACIIGTPDPAPRVIEERRATHDEGCETRSVRRSDDMGNTETRTRTNCD